MSHKPPDFDLIASEQENREEPKRYLPWLIWGLGAFFFFSEYFVRVSPSVMVSQLMKSLHVNALELGTLSAFFYIAYIVMQIPVGVLVDRYSARFLLTFTAFLTALGCALFAMSDSLLISKLGRLLMGFGGSFAFVCTLKLSSVWFAPSRFGLLAGMTQALGMFGAAVGEAPMALAVSHLGWRGTTWMMGSIFVILAILMGVFVRDYPPRYLKRHSGHKKLELHDLWAGIKVVLCNSQTWMNCLYIGFLYASSAAFAELWGVSFLHSAYQVEHSVAAAMVSCIFIGWGIGSPLAGWFSDRIQRRKPIMLLSSICGIILMSCVIYLPNLPVFAVFILLFLYGFTNTGVSVSYAVAGEINPHRVTGTSIAITNMASVLIGSAFQPIIGWFLDLRWKGEMLNGVPYFYPDDYRWALMSLPIFLVISLFFSFFVKETYCKKV